MSQVDITQYLSIVEFMTMIFITFYVIFYLYIFDFFIILFKYEYKLFLKCYQLLLIIKNILLKKSIYSFLKSIK